MGESGTGDVELLIDVCKMGVDRLVGDKQQLSDLGVAVSMSSELSDAQLAGGEGLDAGEPRAARSGTCSAQFIHGALAEQLSARAGGVVDRAAKRFASLDIASLPALQASKGVQRP